MNLSIINTRCILFFVLVIFTGIQSRSLEKRANGNDSCTVEVVNKEVKVPTCLTRIVPVRRCKGSCLSYAIPSSSSTTVVKSCNCCRRLETDIVAVELFCLDSNQKIVKRLHDIEFAKSCSCLPCI
jgi:hypothetical protein